MGSCRTCGETCHNAKRPKCACWCGGLFHGAAGIVAREVFTQTFAAIELPTTEAEFLELTGQPDLFGEQAAGAVWRAAMAAAVAARDQANARGGERRTPKDGSSETNAGATISETAPVES